MFSTRFYHILTCTYTVFLTHSKISNTDIFFINVISKITNSGKNNYFLVFVILEHLPYITFHSVNIKLLRSYVPCIVCTFIW